MLIANPYMKAKNCSGESLETLLHLHVLLPLDACCHGPVHPEHGVGGEEDDERLPALHQQRGDVLNSRAQVPHPVQAVQRENLICDRSKNMYA